MGQHHPHHCHLHLIEEEPEEQRGHGTGPRSQWAGCGHSDPAVLPRACAPSPGRPQPCRTASLTARPCHWHLYIGCRTARAQLLVPLVKSSPLPEPSVSHQYNSTGFGRKAISQGDRRKNVLICVTGLEHCLLPDTLNKYEPCHYDG